jgi:hypothetical protein
MVVPAVAIGRHRPNASIDRWCYHLTERPRFGVRNQKHQALDSTERLVFLPVSRLIRRSTARTTCWTLVPLSCDGLSKNALVRPLGLLVVGSSEKYCCVPVAYPGARATRDRLQLCRFRASLRCVAPGCHRPDPVAPVRRRLSAPLDPPGGEFSAGWFDHAGQVGPRVQGQVGHREAPGWRKLSATATSSRPGDVRPAKSANVQATAKATNSHR